MPFSDEQKIAYIQEILKIWSNRVDEKLSFTTIIKEAEKKGMKKDAVMDYLKILMGEKELFGAKKKVIERIKVDGKKPIYRIASIDLYYGILGISKIQWAPPEEYLPLCYKVGDVVAKGFNETIELLGEDQTFQKSQKLERLNNSTLRFMDTLKEIYLAIFLLMQPRLISHLDCYGKMLPKY